jgi:hypothetical protein
LSVYGQPATNVKMFCMFACLHLKVILPKVHYSKDNIIYVFFLLYY